MLFISDFYVVCALLLMGVTICFPSFFVCLLYVCRTYVVPIFFALLDFFVVSRENRIFALSILSLIDEDFCHFMFA